MFLSEGVKLAWQLAGDLALREQESSIQPRHILYGICAVEKLVNSEDLTLKNGNAIKAAKPEADRLAQLFAGQGVDVAALRRQLRVSPSSAVRKLQASAQSQPISRSPATKQIFEAAEQGAMTMGNSQLDLVALFGAAVRSNDPEIEIAIASFKTGLLDGVRQLSAVKRENAQFAISLGGGIKDLDKAAESRPALQIEETIDANAPLRSQTVANTIERLASLTELTWELGTREATDSLLQKAVDQLLRAVGKGERCVILVRDVKDNELLLKAFGPASATPMISLTSAKRAIVERQAFIWKRGEDLTLSQKESNVESGMYVPLVVNGQAIGVICLDCFCPRQNFAREDLVLVSSFAHQLALAIANHELQLSLKQSSDVLERLLTNFSPKIRTRLLQRAQMGRLRLGGEQSIVSVLCADIRGFARIAAGMETDDVVSLLNEYFTALTECIFRHDGTVDKFVGDSILAVFGSPESDPDHWRKAVLAGMEMQKAAQEVSKNRKAKGEVTCEIGIGIHSGEVLHGFIGSPSRMEFTIIGDAVNRAARYCDGAKGNEVLISPEVHERVWNAIEVQQISIPTKHEGDLIAFRVLRMRERG